MLKRKVLKKAKGLKKGKDQKMKGRDSSCHERVGSSAPGDENCSSSSELGCEWFKFVVFKLFSVLVSSD